MTTTLGTPGSDRDKEPQSYADQLAEQIAMRKGAMYDFCIHKGLEIAVPDAGMRKLFLDHGQPVPGMNVHVSFHNLPEHCEKVTVTYMAQTVSEALIKSTIFSDRIEVKMLEFKVRNIAGEMVDAPHIYGQ